MRKFGIIAVLALLVTALAAVPALAVTNLANAPQGTHYARGSAEPICTVTGNTVNCTGTAFQGVGNTNATTTLAVTSRISGVCENPGSKSKVVEPFSRSITQSTSALAEPSRNGRIDIAPISQTGVSSEQFLATFTCPNPNWTPVVTSNVLSFEYTVTFDGFNAPVIRITG